MPKKIDAASSTRYTIALAIFAICVALFFTVGIQRHADAPKYCGICAEEEQVNYWTIHGTNLQIHHSTNMVETPFSSLLASRKLVATHQHKWLEPVRVPDVNNYGTHQMATLGDLNTERNLSFVRNLSDYAEPWLRDQWIGIMMVPETAHIFDPTISYFGMPAQGFTQKIDFQRWIGEHAHNMGERIEVLTGRD